MAKVIKHGKYWVEEAQKSYKSVRVKCPECGAIILMSSYYVYINPNEAWCDCGCQFIPEAADIVKEDEI
jgi:hypothetical protein